MTIPEHLANKDLDAAAVLSPLTELPSRARVVIVGGGIIGSSIAYHLTRAGERDVVLLERGRLTNGTTWHAAGLVSQIRGTHALTQLTKDNAATYERLTAETGVETGMRRNGAMTIARTPGRLQEAMYGVAMAEDVGVDVEVLDRDGIKRLLAVRERRRPIRRRELPDRRHGEPGRRDRSRSPRARSTRACGTCPTPR